MHDYHPRLVPADVTDVEKLIEFIQSELRFLAVKLQSEKYTQLISSAVAPVKPREGMIVLADGSNWDPGSGAGFYGYYGGSWVKLG